MIKNILLFLTILGCSTAWLYLLYIYSGPDDRLKVPKSIEDIASLAEVLQANIPYTLLLFSSTYLYKQTFAIPGSIFLNLLSGALFGLWKGFLLCNVLSAIGASFCFLISKFVTHKILLRFVSNKIVSFRKLVTKNEDRLFFFLLSLRIFPMTPNWLLNMSSPIVGVPLLKFFFSVLVGLTPYNFLTVQAGSMLSELKTLDDIISPKIGIGLGILAIAVLGPGLVKKKQL